MVIAAIKEFREGIPQKNVRSYTKLIDENGDEIGEVNNDENEQNEGGELGGFDNYEPESRSNFEEESGGEYFEDNSEDEFDYDDEMDLEDIPEEFRPIFKMGRE